MREFSYWCFVQLLCVALAIFNACAAVLAIRNAFKEVRPASRLLLLAAFTPFARIIWLVLIMLFPQRCVGDGAIGCAIVAGIIFPVSAALGALVTLLVLRILLKSNAQWAVLSALFVLGFLLELVRAWQTEQTWALYWWWLVH